VENSLTVTGQLDFVRLQSEPKVLGVKDELVAIGQYQRDIWERNQPGS
jgi:hypothetical protein